MADYLPQLLLAWSIQWVGIVSPGPSVMLILGVATQHGRGRSLITAGGIAGGSMLLATCTVLGISALVAQIAGVMTVLRWVGAAYLFWLAYKSFKTAWRNPPLPQVAVQSQHPMKTAISGFLLQATNPKAVGFWLAIAAVGGVGDAPWLVLVLFIAGAFINSFLGHGAYALLLSSPPIRSLYVRFRRGIESLLGSLFLLAGIRLLSSR